MNDKIPDGVQVYKLGIVPLPGCPVRVPKLPHPDDAEAKPFAALPVEADHITLTFPEDSRGKSIYRSYPTMIYPWWAPFWLRRKLPYRLRRRVPCEVGTEYVFLGIIGEEWS